MQPGYLKQGGTQILAKRTAKTIIDLHTEIQVLKEEAEKHLQKEVAYHLAVASLHLRNASMCMVKEGKHGTQESKEQT